MCVRQCLSVGYEALRVNVVAMTGRERKGGRKEGRKGREGGTVGKDKSWRRGRGEKEKA